MTVNDVRSQGISGVVLAAWTPTRRILGKIKRSLKRRASGFVSTRKLSANVRRTYQAARDATPKAELPPLPESTFSHVDMNFAARALADGLAKIAPEAPTSMRELGDLLSNATALHRIDPEIAALIGVRFCGANRSSRAATVIAEFLKRYADTLEPEPLLASQAFRSLKDADADYARTLLTAQYLRAGRPGSAVSITQEQLARDPKSQAMRLRHAITCMGAQQWDEAFELLPANPSTGSRIGLKEAQTILSTLQSVGHNKNYWTLVTELMARGDHRALAALAVAASAFPTLVGLLAKYMLSVEDRAALQDGIAANLLVLRRSLGTFGKSQARAIRRRLLPLLDEPLAALVENLLFESGRGSDGEVGAIRDYLGALGRTNLDMGKDMERILAFDGVYEIDEATAGLKGQARRHTFADVFSEDCAVVSLGAMSRQIYTQSIQDHSGDVYSLGVEPYVEGLCSVHRIMTNFPMVGSAGDIEAVLDAQQLASSITDLVFPARADKADAEVVEELFSLGLWDLVVTPSRRLWTLKKMLAARGAKRALFVATSDYPIAMAYATAIKHQLGIEVLIAYGGPPARYSALIQSWDYDASTNENAIARAWSTKFPSKGGAHVSAQDLIDASMDAELGEQMFGFGAALQNAKPDPTPIDALILASMSDPNYFLAAEEIAQECARTREISVVNLTTKNVNFLDGALEERFFSAPDIVPLDANRNEYCQAAAKTIVDALSGPYTNVNALGLVSILQIFTFLMARFPAIVREVCYFQAYMRTHRVLALVAIPGRHITCRALTLYANRNDITTMDVQAFFISEHVRYRRSVAQIYCGTIDEQIELYKRSKSPPPDQAIVRIGSLPIARRTRAVVDLTAAAARVRYGLPANARIVMYAAQHGGVTAETMQIVALLANVLAPNPETFLIVKMHPRSPEAYLKDVANELTRLGFGERAAVFREQDIYELITASDLIITQFSNVGLEAAVLDRQTLAVNLTEADYPIDLHAMGVAEMASTEEEVKERVHALLFDDAAKAAAAKRREGFFGRNPEIKAGSGAATIAALIPSRTDV